MGKRELLLVVGFVIVGVVVYQVTAPPPAPGERGFSLGAVDRGGAPGSPRQPGLAEP